MNAVQKYLAAQITSAVQKALGIEVADIEVRDGFLTLKIPLIDSTDMFWQAVKEAFGD